MLNAVCVSAPSLDSRSIWRHTHHVLNTALAHVTTCFAGGKVKAGVTAYVYISNECTSICIQSNATTGRHHAIQAYVSDRMIVKIFWRIHNYAKMV